MEPGKRILAVLAGVITAFILLSILELISFKLFPLPPGVDLHDKAAIIKASNDMPLSAHLLQLLNYIISTFAGGFVATKAAKGNKTPAIIAGIVLTIAGLINTIELQEPIWFMIASVVVYIPAAYAGFLAARKKSM